MNISQNQRRGTIATLVCACRIIVGWLIALSWISASADVKLAALFTDHLILQRDQPAAIWGWADPGERVTVSFRGHLVAANADGSGRWRVRLGPLAATDDPSSLTVTGRNTILLRDVVVGEVWLCSGQSNMAFSVGEAKNATAEIASARHPQIRHFRVAQHAADRPADDVAGAWVVCSPETVASFTAVGYFFARDLRLRLGVPVGLINSSWGGTYIESWMSEETLRSDPAFDVVLERRAEFLARYPTARAAHERDLAEWRRSSAAAKAVGRQFANPEPRVPIGPEHRNLPTNLYNGMIRPLMPYAIRGVIWYQGEANGDRAGEYRALFAALISQWRREWGAGDFPFYFAQLSSFKAADQPAGTDWAWLREAQAQVLALPATGLAVTLDIGDPDDVHPRNKQEVGRRLALLARARTYNESGLADSGPVLRASVFRDGVAELAFDNVDDLDSTAAPLRGFEIAGKDRRFMPAAAAATSRGTVIVSSLAVPEPAAVRYAWRNVTDGNLRNIAGLPAGTFRTDTWPRSISD